MSSTRRMKIGDEEADGGVDHARGDEGFDRLAGIVGDARACARSVPSTPMESASDEFLKTLRNSLVSAGTVRR